MSAVLATTNTAIAIAPFVVNHFVAVAGVMVVLAMPPDSF